MDFKKVKECQQALENLKQWFETHQRILPWRSEPTVYRIWISEMMLQQTQVSTVLPYFERFIQRFPDVETLAHSSLDEVYCYWAGLGYYSRARYLYQAAQKIVAQGGFPKTRNQWLKMPGVGLYTAGAIVSIAFNHPEPILDGNVERVLSRVYGVGREKGDTDYKKKLWLLSQQLVRKSVRLKILPSLLNQALMELGATVCTSKKPKCHQCAFMHSCFSFQTRRQEDFPPKKKRKPSIIVHEKVFCFIDIQGRILLHQCLNQKWRKGLWDLPEWSFPDLQRLALRQGELHTQYTVTRHKVKRVIEIWKFSSTVLTAHEALGKEYQWIHLQTKKLALGAPLKKVIGEIYQMIQV